MSSDAFAELPFPAVGGMPVRTDSVAEEYAFLHAYPHAAGGWQIGKQALFIGPQGAEDHLQVIAPDGSETMVRFNVESFYGSERRGFGSPSARLDGAMQRAMTWAKENEPSHPGIRPRFPVPAEGYPGKVTVPMALIASDDTKRAGLFGPTRVVVVGWREDDVVGATDAPGFDPLNWPPPRLSTWPPPGLDGIDRERLSGIVGRFSAVWARLLDAYLFEEEYPQRRFEAQEALMLLGLLDPPPMTAVYREISPRFWAWLADDSGVA